MTRTTAKIARFHERPEARIGPDPDASKTILRGLAATMIMASAPSKAISCRWTVRRDGLRVAIRPWFATANGLAWFSGGFYTISIPRFVLLKVRGFFRERIPRAHVVTR